MSSNLSSEELEKKAELISLRMRRNRLDPNKEYKGYKFYGWRDVPGKHVERVEWIKRKLEDGCVVRSGYFTTAVRGFHEAYLMVRNGN